MTSVRAFANAWAFGSRLRIHCWFLFLASNPYLPFSMPLPLWPVGFASSVGVSGWPGLRLLLWRFFLSNCGLIGLLSFDLRVGGCESWQLVRVEYWANVTSDPQSQPGLDSC